MLLGNPTSDLGGSEEEVRGIDRQLRGKGFVSHAFLGHWATSASLSDRSRTAGILHLACHSRLEAEDFPRSGIELADRRLTVFDLAARLKLEQASLVYLSSCDSGRAVAGRTDDLLALVRTFLCAGCPTVIASLWGLRDEVGRDFALLFYHFWLGEALPLAEAFRRAVREIRSLGYAGTEWAPLV